MQKVFLILLICIISICSAIAQDSKHKIEISSPNYDKDKIVIGYYFGDRQLVLDTIEKNNNSKFVLEGNEPLKQGVYLLLLVPNNRYIQFIVNENEQKFSIKIDTSDLGNPIISGSKDNKLFLDYVNYLNERSEENKSLTEEIKNNESAGESIEEIQKKQKELDNKVKKYQNDLIANNPKSVTAKLIKSTKEIEIPEFEGTDDQIKSQQYYYYKKHYFDYIDLADPTLLRTPFLHNKVDSYLNKLTPQVPDSLNNEIDFLLEKMRPAPETFKFYLSHFLNTYAGSKIVGFDAMYVHLVEKYYSKGDADWVEQENLDKIISEAKKLKPLLIGQVAQDIKVYRRDKTPISLSDIKTKYLLLYFWAPDCGHCKLATPHVIDFYNKYKKTTDIEILAVCTKHRDKEPDCWDAVDEKGMDIWINASDVNHLSRFRDKYNVEQTPSIFILNEKREIIMKRIGAEHLDEVMQEILRIDDLKAIEEQIEKSKK